MDVFKENARQLSDCGIEMEALLTHGSRLGNGHYFIKAFTKASRLAFNVCVQYYIRQLFVCLRTEQNRSHCMTAA